MRRLFRHPSFVAGGLLVLAYVAMAALAPWITRHEPNAVDLAARLRPPGEGHLLGTDNLGRDLWARLVFGSRVSLGAAVASVCVAASVGTAVGMVAGYFGGRVDMALMRMVDLFLGFPPLILALALVAALGPRLANVVVALSVVLWTQYARLARASTLAEKSREYVEAARAAGASDARILARHILPNVVGPVVVMATLGLGTAIVAESTLSFLGFGVQPPQPSWGWTLAYGMRFLRNAPHLSTFTGLFIMGAVLAFNLMGDGLRDALDPRGLVRWRG